MQRWPENYQWPNVRYDPRYQDRIEAVDKICKFWTASAPYSRWDAHDDSDGDDEADDEENSEPENDGHAKSYHTRSARWDAQPSEPDDSPTRSPPSKRAKRQMDDSVGSTETLIGLADDDRALSSEEKDARITSWIHDVARESWSEVTPPAEVSESGRAAYSFILVVWANLLTLCWLSILDVASSLVGLEQKLLADTKRKVD